MATAINAAYGLSLNRNDMSLWVISGHRAA
jgi:hypothetical protein